MSSADEQGLVWRAGDAYLTGILHRGRPARSIGIVFVVGGPQYRVGSHRQFVRMARSFAAKGYTNLRFDYRGMGDADGPPQSFADTAFDIRSAIEEFLLHAPSVSQVVLCGLCDGATASILYAPSDDRVAGLLLLNPWAEHGAAGARRRLKYYYLPRLFSRGFWEKLRTSRRLTVGTVRRFLKSAFGSDSAELSKSHATPAYLVRLSKAARSYRGAVLLVASSRDLTVREFLDLGLFDSAWRRVFTKPEWTVNPIDGADHTFSKGADLHKAIDCSLSWLRKSFETD